MTTIDIELYAEYRNGNFLGYDTSFYVDGELLQWTKLCDSMKGLVIAVHDIVITEEIKNPEYNVKLLGDPIPSDLPKRVFCRVRPNDGFKSKLVGLLNSELEFRSSKEFLASLPKLEGITYLSG